MNGNSDTVSPPSMHQTTPQWSERVWMALIGVLLLNSVLRGIRPPGMWAYTQFLLNYDFGFAKRSLQGAVIDALQIPDLQSYSFAFWYMMTVFIANALLLVWVMQRLCATGDLTARLTASVFASSLAVVLLANIVGYGDQPALLITLLALSIRNFYHRCIFVAALFPICLLIQETEFVFFFPLITFRFLIDLDDAAMVKHRKLPALCLMFVCVFATLLALGNTHMSKTSAAELFNSMQSRAEYRLSPHQTDMLTTTFTDFFEITARFYSDQLARRFFFLSWIVTLPTTAYLMHRTLSLMTHNGHSVTLRAAAMCASAAPLAVHVIAFDTNRFTALATLTSFLVYATVRLQGRISDAAVSASQSNPLLPTALIVMGLTSSIPLFGGYVVRSFPYEELLDDFRNVVAGSESFPPLPEQCSVASNCYFIRGVLKPPQSAISQTDFCANNSPLSAR